MQARQRNNRIGVGSGEAPGLVLGAEAEGLDVVILSETMVIACVFGTKISPIINRTKNSAHFLLGF